MKKFIPAAALLLVASIGVGASCEKPTPKQIVNSALDVAQVACILLQEWTDDASAVAHACGIVEDYLPEVRKLVDARKQAATMKKAMLAASGSAAPVVAPPKPSASGSGATK